ncbi:MAG: hypothetical protein D6796_11150 [Caldilineae bacterium]|nr:MAG: hypothetical protein D6796_11150 [Caldilineae bacterium]
MRLLVVLGEGGHTKEMITLVDMLSAPYEYGYVVVRGDEVSEAKIRRPGKIYHITRPRYKRLRFWIDSINTLRCAVEAFRILREFRPVAVVSAGPSVAVPVSLVAKWMGISVIFVETGSRITSLSMTGRILYRFADLFFVQWPELAERFPKAIYAGRLF